MVHPLVEQLRFARSEFVRGLHGVTAPEAQRRFFPMNCISWNVGHLTWQEQRYWLDRAQSRMLLPDVNKQFAYGAPASTPALADMWDAWRVITDAADPWLDSVTPEILVSNVVIEGKLPAGGPPQATSSEYIFGSLLQRMIYHYWYHIGENAAIRQQLGHAQLPDFVGDIDHEAPYRREPLG